MTDKTEAMEHVIHSSMPIDFERRYAMDNLIAQDADLIDAEGVKIYWYRQGKDDGVEHERAKIVAWLRGQDGHGYDAMRAECIEAGEHLK